MSSTISDWVKSYARGPVSSAPARDGLALAGIGFGLLSATYDLTFISYAIAVLADGSNWWNAGVGLLDALIHRIGDAWHMLTSWIAELLTVFRIDLHPVLIRLLAPLLMVMPKGAVFLHDWVLVFVLKKTSSELRQIEQHYRDADSSDFHRRKLEAEQKASHRAGLGAIIGGVIGGAIGAPVMVLGIAAGSFLGAGSVPKVELVESQETRQAANATESELAHLGARIRRFFGTRRIFFTTIIVAGLLAVLHLFDVWFDQKTGSEEGGAGCQLWEVDREPDDFVGETYLPNERCGCRGNGLNGYITRTKAYQSTRADGLLICRVLPAAWRSAS